MRPKWRDAHDDVLVEPTTRRVVRYRTDEVGNDLSARLRWCETHNEPVWVYGDESFTCPHEAAVGWAPDGHALIDAPWETSSPPTDQGEPA